MTELKLRRKYTRDELEALKATVLELREASRELQESNDEAERKEILRLQQMGERRSL